MRNRIHAVLIINLLIAASPAQLSSQGIDSWNNLRTLAEGQKIQVVDTAGQKRSVILISVTDHELMARCRDGQLNFDRSDIAQVIRIDSRMKRRALIGLAVAGGAGIAGGIVMDKQIANEGGAGFRWTGIMAGVGAAVGAAIGAAAGAIPKHIVVYRK